MRYEGLISDQRFENLSKMPEKTLMRELMQDSSHLLLEQA